MLPRPKAATAPARVLIVEDEYLIRAVVAEQMREAGFAVIEAVRADEALAYVEAGGEVDILFSDVNTPGKINGLDLARRLQRLDPSLPVVLTSGNISSQSAVGVGVFLPKPYGMPEAVATVEQALGLR